MTEHNKTFNAHYNKTNDEYQSLAKHCSQTAAFAVLKSPQNQLRHTIKLISLLHDTGKYSDIWQEYFQNAIQYDGGHSGKKEDHTTAGGILAEELLPDSFIKRLVQTAIYAHHGLQDCIAADGTSLFEKRQEKSEYLPIADCKAHFYEDFKAEEVKEISRLAVQEGEQLKHLIQDTVKAWGTGNRYGNRDFLLGMYTRLLCSLLMDADRRDTADFMNGIETEEVFTDSELQNIWSDCVENIEEKLKKFTEKSGINAYRSYVSDICKQKAGDDQRLYRLSLPTGAGKTLSSLRFAAHHAYEHKKKRIIYIAPFHSIVEQNAGEIRKAIGKSEYVLEHHCNIVFENENEQLEYERLTEDWSSPIIVTTAVQFLNTLFTSKIANIRRFQSLSDSVIIMDEVQALPVFTLGLFNLAVNFMTEFLNTTMVLCTATQPLLDQLPENALLPPVEMVEERPDFQMVTQRTRITDATGDYVRGLSIDAAAEFLIDKAEMHRKVLFIANTKACARNLFTKVKSLLSEEVEVVHLSTSMCPEHRSDKLSKIRDGLKTECMQICITTQLIEAGVDISFPCVVRSLAGLDNLIQAAGRCNRNKEMDVGDVYLIKMDESAENLTHLEEIRAAQEAMKKVLDQFRRNPAVLDYALDSKKAIQLYYDDYLWQRKIKLDYPVTVEEVPATIVDLLSGNSEFNKSKRYSRQLLRQAFKTAGDYYEVIPDRGDLSVIVPYSDIVERKLQELEQPKCSYQEKKKLLRELQSFVVSISRSERRKLEPGIRGILDHQVLVLNKRYYSKETGVTTDPLPMEYLCM